MGTIIAADLRRAIHQISRAVDLDSAELCPQVATALAPLTASADWLAPSLRRPDPDRYRRELLYQAADDSFSIGCFVWGAGQQTRIHDHNSWAVLGVVCGSLRETSYDRSVTGELRQGSNFKVEAGQHVWCRPESGDIHRVGAAGRSMAISIHVYGCAFDQVCRTYYPDLAEVMA